MKKILLIDISNSFTKTCLAVGDSISRVKRLPTPSLDAAQLRALHSPAKLDGVVLSSVVPEKNSEVQAAFSRVLEVGAGLDLGVGIDYPSPRTIGADRLANAAACAALHGFPGIVVDFGTAVTFDIVSQTGDYIGGVIAPGLNAMTSYLHDRTALLPNIKLREPSSAVGRSTRDAMLSGAVHGYRGLVREILSQIRSEAFPKKRPRIIATGGDAELIAGRVGLFDIVDPLLTLRGLLVIAQRNL
ncbi:MAG: type III pantothenate kinase [Verrucomicrobia bacterium]|nr:type III pantothenate kinase [Verrucomicrobiota bacterium]